MVDLRQRDELVREIDGALRRFEEGAPPPIAARDLLTKLAASLAESSPDEAGLSPPQLRFAQEAAAHGVDGLENEDSATQGREAERALRALARIFSEQTPTAARREEPRRPSAAGETTRGRVPRWLLIALSVVVAGGIAAVAVGRSTRVSPRWGKYAGYPSGRGSGFKISFVVSPPTVVNGVAHVEINDVAQWHASCESGRVWVDESQSLWTSLSAWNERAFNYVTDNAFGKYAHPSGGSTITEHIHVIEDMGHFTSPSHAAGLFNLSVALYQNGRQIDTCRTGIVRWLADWVAN